MKRKDWTGGLFFIYLAFVIWVILLKLDVYKRQVYNKVYEKGEKRI